MGQAFPIPPGSHYLLYKCALNMNIPGAELFYEKLTTTKEDIFLPFDEYQALKQHFEFVRECNAEKRKALKTAVEQAQIDLL
jgi:hypothetical protein